MKISNFKFQLRLNRSQILIVFILLISIALRFYNLNWGSPFYFHPDERNIASAVSGLNFPQQLNPHFFAYGSLPIYAIYLTGIILHVVHPMSLGSSPFTVSFSEAIIISRFFSALFSSLIIFSLYIIGTKLKSDLSGLKNKTAGIFSALLGVTGIGFLQYSHFGTFEMWLAFWSLWYFFVCFKITQKATFLRFIICGLILGTLIAIKISSATLILLPLFIVFTPIGMNKKTALQIMIKLTVLVLSCLAIVMFLCPFFFLDFIGFQSSMRYESAVALGSLPVFYTRGFVHTTPVLYQLRFVLPFLLNPLIFLIFLISCGYLFFLTYKKDKTALLLLTTFVIIFFPSAILFVKWTRYMVPVLPIIYLFIGYAVSNISRYSRIKKYSGIFVFIVFFICIAYDFLYFFTVLTSQDTRIAAYNYAITHIPINANVLSENYDLGVLPFSMYRNLAIFNFYDLDTNPQQKNILTQILKNYNYILLPSQRISRMRYIHPHAFPISSGIYQQLFLGDLGYIKIYETPCDVFCQIFYGGSSIYGYEETVNIFDRPTVYIFKKI